MIKVFRESHPTPDWACRRLTSAGGLNRFDEPNFRLVWSNDRMQLIGGRWEDRDNSGNLIREVLAMRREPKYPHLPNRWLVEQWLAPEKFGSPESWLRNTKEWGEEGNIPQLGPYPSRGDYTLACVLEINGQFIQLTSTILDWTIEALRQKKEQQRRIHELREAQERKKQAERVFARDLLADGTRYYAPDERVTVL